MSKRGQNVAKSIRDSAVYAALAAGDSTHEQIAARLGCSRQHVSRVAVAHRAEIDAAAAKTRQTAVDVPARAREKLMNATLEAAEAVLSVMRGEVEDPSMAAQIINGAKTVLDRGGVPAKADVNHTVEVTPEKLERVMAMARLLA